MPKRIGVVSAIAVLATTWAIRGNAAEERQTLPKPPDKQMLRAEEVKQMLLLMDTDENGKISKQEWLRFMEAEFDRLDPGRTRSLDPRKLAVTNAQIRHIRSSDLGK
jgi:EF hand